MNKELFELITLRTKPVTLEEKVTFVKAILPGLSEMADRMKLDITLHIASVNAGISQECLEEQLAKFLNSKKL